MVTFGNIFVILSDIKNGSGLFDLGNGIDVDTQKKEATVAEGDTITVTCGALRQIYSNITWFFNDKPLADDGGAY